MATKKQLQEWKEQGEASLADKNKRKAEEAHRQELALHLRQEGLAAEKEAKVRTDARRIWIQEGGSVSEFDAKWEKMYQEIIYARTVEKLRDGSYRPDGSRRYRL